MSEFQYTYSAPEQEEIRKIREKYLVKEESSLEKLRALDARAHRPGTVWSLVLGVLGMLLFGTGMSLCLVWKHYAMGIGLGAVGAAAMGLAYPAYSWITKKQRKKYAPEILALTEELGR